MNKYMTATKARAKFFDVIDTKPGVSVFIMLEGQPKAVVMSVDDYEGWMETMEIMSDPSLVADIQESERQKESGDVIDFNALKKKYKA